MKDDPDDPGTLGRRRPALPTAVRAWLLLCCAMVLAMMGLGAVTRLTQSGLSITTWDPIIGAVPPLDHADWQRAFAAYQAIPQYRLFNQGMTLEAFQHIFFWEWLHRLWGRLIGLAFALPLVAFVVRRMIDGALATRLGLILALGGLQGAIGWFMVQSGLSERTSVAPLRLALHLDMAVAIYALLVWVLLSGGTAPTEVGASRSLRRQGWLTLGLLLVTMTLGALVAGTQGGTIHTTWPLMDGALVPATALALDPLWLNLVENPVLVQFLHRWLGPLTLAAIGAWAWRCRGETSLAAMALVQVGLGVATLATQAETVIAVVHQAGAMALLTLMLRALHRRPAGARPGK